MYTFKAEIDYKGFFFINKEIIVDGTWAKLSQSGRAILPVILKHRNKQGIAFPSQETIGIISGLSEKAVSCGIKSIKEHTEIEVEEHYNAKGYLKYEYHIPPSIIGFKKEGRIRISNALFDSGCWRMLSSSGKSLYIVLQTLAKLDIDAEDWEYDNFDEWYPQRKYDIVDFVSKSQLAKLAGISRPTLDQAIASLRITKLLQDTFTEDNIDLSCEQQRIYIVPQFIYPSTQLNEGIQNPKRKIKKL